MHKNMAHTLYLTPIDIGMTFTEFFRKHIDSFAYYFYKLRKTIKNELALLYVLKSILGMKFLYALYRFKDVPQSTSISNLLSHKSKTYHGWQTLVQKAKDSHSRPCPLYDEASLLNQA